jgi:hypothetical protein
VLLRREGHRPRFRHLFPGRHALRDGGGARALPGQ